MFDPDVPLGTRAQFFFSSQLGGYAFDLGNAGGKTSYSFSLSQPRSGCIKRGRPACNGHNNGLLRTDCLTLLSAHVP